MAASWAAAHFHGRDWVFLGWFARTARKQGAWTFFVQYFRRASTRITAPRTNWAISSMPRIPSTRPREVAEVSARRQARTSRPVVLRLWAIVWHVALTILRLPILTFTTPALN